MAINENNRILIQELEEHAEKADLLKDVESVSRRLKNVKVYKGKYLVLDLESQSPAKKASGNSRTTKKKK